MIEVAKSVDITGGLVVGHDGSPASAQAARWAARLAVRLGIPLHVVRTWSLSTAPRPATATSGYVPPMTDFEQAVHDRLRADVAALGLADGCVVHCHVVHGAAAKRLLQAAAHAELLVVGSRGEGGSGACASGPPPTRWCGTRRARWSWFPCTLPTSPPPRTAAPRGVRGLTCLRRAGSPNRPARKQFPRVQLCVCCLSV